MRGSHRVAHLPGCSEGIGSSKRRPGNRPPDFCVFGHPDSASSDKDFASSDTGPGLGFAAPGLGSAAAAGLPAAASCGVTLSPKNSWWSRSQDPDRGFFEKEDKADVNLPLDVALARGAPESHEAWTLPAKLLDFSKEKWQFFVGSLTE